MAAIGDNNEKSPIEQEGQAIVETYNEALEEEYQPRVEWFAMQSGNATENHECFALRARYFIEEGLSALREAGYIIVNIEPFPEIDHIEDDEDEAIIAVRKTEEV